MSILIAAAAATRRRRRSRVIVSDTFTRADSATTLGSAETGQAWTALGGETWGISANRAYLVSWVTGNDSVVVDAGAADVAVRVTISTVASAVCGITLRATDNNNWWRVVRSGVSNVLLQKNMAGAVTTVGTAAATMSDGAVLVVRCVGNAISVTMNGAPLSALSVTDAFNATATKHGLHCNAITATRFDDFQVTTP